MEKGVKILVTCPSNVACAGFAESLIRMSLKVYGFKIKVLRMLSKRKELRATMVVAEDEYDDSDPNYQLLHLEVRKTNLWNTIQHLQPDSQRYCKTKDILAKIDEVTAKAEAEVLEKADIIICTTGCATDFRLMKFKANIRTLIVDEAGQDAEPSLLPLLQFEPERLIICGDHKQLRPLVNELL